MSRLSVVSVMCMVTVLCCGSAWAGEYRAVEYPCDGYQGCSLPPVEVVEESVEVVCEPEEVAEEPGCFDPGNGPFFGIGGYTQEIEYADGYTDREYLPTINVMGYLTDYLAWDSFFSLDEELPAYGGSADLKLLEWCNSDSAMWIGAGAIGVDYNTDDTRVRTTFGPDLAMGCHWNNWASSVHASYLSDEFVIRASLMHDINWD